MTDVQFCLSWQIVGIDLNNLEFMIKLYLV